jgi:hypothetical protein
MKTIGTTWIIFSTILSIIALIYIQFSNIDMTQARLFVTYFPAYVLIMLVLTTNALMADKIFKN